MVVRVVLTLAAAAVRVPVATRVVAVPGRLAVILVILVGVETQAVLVLVLTLAVQVTVDLMVILEQMVPAGTSELQVIPALRVTKEVQVLHRQYRF